MAWKNDQVSEKETEIILDLARKCLEAPGDFVEMGCYRGDTSLLLAEVLRDFEKKMSVASVKPVENFSKKMWIYDSFEGLPEKKPEDFSALGENFTSGELSVSKREVKERFLRAGLKVPVIHKGWFSELNPDDMPSAVAFAFLDGDFYESIRDSLNLVLPLMTPGGVIIVHDYNNPALPGVKRAVEEKIGTRGLQVLESCAIIEAR